MAEERPIDLLLFYIGSKEPPYMFKGIHGFNRQLTAKQLMQADLLENI